MKINAVEKQLPGKVEAACQSIRTFYSHLSSLAQTFEASVNQGGASLVTQVRNMNGQSFNIYVLSF